jgi:hypothetical protein
MLARLLQPPDYACPWSGPKQKQPALIWLVSASRVLLGGAVVLLIYTIDFFGFDLQ